MNAPRQNPNRFWAGLSFCVLLGFSGVNLFILIFTVPKFGVIYQDALPGKPLPVVTELIFGGRFLIVLVNVAWLILCSYLARRHNRHSILATNVASIWNLLQAGTTLVALFMPMCGTITGMAQNICA